MMRVLPFAAAALAAASEAPPTVGSTFCASVNQSMLVEGQPDPSAPPTIYTLCMDSGSVPKWASNRMNQDARFNGTDLFTITSNSSAPSGKQCVRKTFGPATLQQMPWSMIALDDGTTFNTTTTLDGFKNVDVFAHERPAKPPYPAQRMEWFIDHDALAGGSAHELLRTAATLGCAPPNTGKTCTGNRDFSASYTATPPAGTFADPSTTKMPCDFAGGSSKPFTPATDCKPACKSGALCCEDPSQASPTGTCFVVSECSQLPGGPGDATFLKEASF